MCHCGVNLSFGVQYLCLPVTTHLDHEITQTCIMMWPDFTETCLSVVVGDSPLNDNFINIVQELRVTFYISQVSQHVNKVGTRS